MTITPTSSWWDWLPNAGTPVIRMRTHNGIAVLVLVLALAAVKAPAEEPRPQPRAVDGWVVEQVAGPDQVVFPMFACFDDRGRLFVSESSGGDLYAELAAGKKTGRIKCLEDKDGDGSF